MREFVLWVHITTSTLVAAITFILVIRSVLAIWVKYSLKWYDRKLPLWITLLLYFQLLLGLLLFILILTDYHPNLSQAVNKGAYQVRFWAIEHFSLMVFSLLFSHIGYYYNKNIQTPEVVFQKNLLYFGITLILICISMMMNAH